MFCTMLAPQRFVRRFDIKKTTMTRGLISGECVYMWVFVLSLRCCFIQWLIAHFRCLLEDVYALEFLMATWECVRESSESHFCLTGVLNKSLFYFPSQKGSSACLRTDACCALKVTHTRGKLFGIQSGQSTTNTPAYTLLVKLMFFPFHLSEVVLILLM